MTLGGAIALFVTGILVALAEKAAIPGADLALLEFILVGLITGGIAVAASKLRDLGYLPLVLLLILPLGCTISGALYQDTNRAIVKFEGKGGDTFCWKGLTSPIVIGAVGWGKHECQSLPAVRLVPTE
jgi:hypothetical protein